VADIQKLSKSSIPDRQGCPEPEKRVLDALAIGIRGIEAWAEKVRKSLIDLEAGGKELKAATKVAEEEATSSPSTDNPRYTGTKSIELVDGTSFQFVNDEDPAARKVYCTNADGELGWLTAADFISIVLGEDLDSYMNTYMTNYIKTNARKQYVCTGVQYDEPTGVFSQVFVELQVLGVVEGSQLVGNVFIGQGCDP